MDGSFTPLTFDVDNQTFGDLTQVTSSPASPATCTAPATIPTGQRGSVTVLASTGSVSYSTGNPLYPITIAWAPGAGGVPALSVKPPATTDAGLTLLSLLAEGAPAGSTEVARATATTPAQDAALAQQESATDAARLTDPQPRQSQNGPPSSGPAGAPTSIGVVHLYLSLTIRLNNQTGQQIALTSTNADLEITFAKAPSASVTPPPAVESNAVQEFTAYTWPQAFAKYAISQSNWLSCWVEVRWSTQGAVARVVSANPQRAALQATTTLAPPGGSGDPVYIVTISRAPAGVPISPVVGTTRDVYQTYQRVTDRQGNARDVYTVGHAHTKDRMVLGVDVSAYQPTIDFKKMCDFVDSDGRRVWFCSAQCHQPRGADAFKSHWQALSRTRLLRFPYVFLNPLDRAASRNASDATLQSLADTVYEDFKNQYTFAGGWRHYDLPPGVDFEPVYFYTDPADGKKKAISPSTAQMASPGQRQDAWTLLCVMRTFIRRLTASFGTPPFFYSGSSFFTNWYPVARLGLAQERPNDAWDDSWLDPIFDCRIWHSEYPYRASPTTNPHAWPWPQPAGYGGRWFAGPWDIYQFGVAREHSQGQLLGADATPLDASEAGASWSSLPEADASSFGIARQQVDLDVWRGSVPELIDLAVQSRWDPDA